MRVDTTKGKKPLTSDEKQARDKARRAERKARRLAAEEGWKAQVAAHFGFLETTYGFHFANVDGASWWQTTVRYDSPQLAVEIANSRESVCVELCLIRLVDGRVPEYPIFINPDTPINYVYMHKVLEVRAPHEAQKLRELQGLSDEEVERSLVFLSDMLRTHCDDVLRGDFAIFDVIAEQMHEYAREHPQGIRIIVPDTTPQEEALARVEETRGAFPQQPVTLEYYTTKKRRPRRKDTNDYSQGNATP